MYRNIATVIENQLFRLSTKRFLAGKWSVVFSNYLCFLSSCIQLLFLYLTVIFSCVKFHLMASAYELGPCSRDRIEVLHQLSLSHNCQIRMKVLWGSAEVSEWLEESGSDYIEQYGRERSTLAREDVFLERLALTGMIRLTVAR